MRSTGCSADWLAPLAALPFITMLGRGLDSSTTCHSLIVGICRRVVSRHSRRQRDHFSAAGRPYSSNSFRLRGMTHSLMALPPYFITELLTFARYYGLMPLSISRCLDGRSASRRLAFPHACQSPRARYHQLNDEALTMRKPISLRLVDIVISFNRAAAASRCAML